MKKYNIGIDLGGTKILCAIVENSTNKILFEVKKKTKKEKGEERIIKKLTEAIDELFEISKIKKEEIISIGIAAAGQVDREKGILINACNLDCKNLELKKILEEKYNIETFIANDVEGATIAELLIGSAKGYKNALCVFVGTGIGSSIVIDGKIYYGATGCAGEIGHITVDLNGRICACGTVGCLEAYASRSAIEERITGAVKKGRKSIISEFTEDLNISTKHIKKALTAHDDVVVRFVAEAIEYLSSGLASAMNFLNPELIVLGGGLIQGVDEIYTKTIRLAKAKALKLASSNIEFKKAEFGDYSGVIGASLIRNYRTKCH